LSAFEVELAIEKLKGCKSLGIDWIPVELLKAGGRTICSEIRKLNISIWNKEELPEECKESIIVPIYNCICFKCLWQSVIPISECRTSTIFPTSQQRMVWRKTFSTPVWGII
jgi:hypothetical protein